jgi:hypothetical protein
MSYVLIMIFTLHGSYYAQGNSNPMIPVVIHADFNSKAACHAAAKALQKSSRADEVYCLPKD